MWALCAPPARRLPRGPPDGRGAVAHFNGGDLVPEPLAPRGGGSVKKRVDLADERSINVCCWGAATPLRDHSGSQKLLDNGTFR
ncbi:hypothetical protein Scani_68520 [Streptomyces caniferus]|uniref:Uncharacterized protein n=1 Tax=Streptomyces caniferus TaxID=285557 RepID=A0A640SIC8_9ACTN|nr:hypothetical protein Scani_68520 [Streptomyces caniferus]